MRSTHTLARRSLVALVAAVGTLVPVSGAAAAPVASPVPVAAGVLSISIPALDPSWTPVTVTARPAPRTLQYPPPPAAVDFSVSPLQRYDPRAADDHLLVSWRNLRSGKTGTLVLRPRQLPEFPTPRNTSHRLPTSAVAPTGSGPVVATVTVIRGSGKATRTVSVTPGATAIDVP